jgi:phospholipase B1
MGGDRDVSSVARMLMHYNPSLAGASRGNTSFIFCYGPICPAGTPFLPFEPESTGLNAAQSGSWTNEHNTENQFKYLDTYYPAFVPKSSPDPWKLIFVEFGFNNICLGCVKWANKTEFSADHYEKHMRFVIEGLRMRFSKAFVVFMSPFNMSQVCFYYIRIL